MAAKQNNINKDMLIGDVIKKHPMLVETMRDHGMNCVGCHIASWETIEQAAEGHGINVNRLVDELNKNRSE